MPLARIIIICLSALVLICQALPAHARDTIIWPYFSFPPLFVVDRDGKLDGIAAGIMKLLWKRLPEYDHRILLVSPRRMMSELRQGRKMAAIGAIWSPVRAKYLHFSLPCRLGYASGLVTRKSNIGRFGPKPLVSFTELLKDKSLKAGIQTGVSYGVALDEILEANPNLPNAMYRSGPTSIEQFLKMIAAGRVDWTAADPMVAGYMARRLGIEKDLLFGEFEEQRRIISVGYIIVPKNQWGKEAMARINRALADAIMSGEFRRVFRPWVDESIQPDFDKHYHEYIYLPAKTALD